MNLPGKSSVALLLFGVLLGIAISPWSAQRPQDFVSSPVTASYAKSRSTDENETKIKESKSTLSQLFSKFDKEQENLTPLVSGTNSTKVLGEMAVGKQLDYMNTKSGNITIALIGDSMIDTMGTNLPSLEKALKQYYPNIKFTLLNYGIGAQSAIKASERIDQPYNYKDRTYPTLTQAGADIILIESFTKFLLNR